jgi:hypothetical protein
VLSASGVEADPAGDAYADDALAPPLADAADDHLVQAFAERIPKMYGAPKPLAIVERIAG